ncbi:MAG: sigma-70 family RNA polymerase sigma factor [Pirellulaceae bacterium]
MNNAEFIDGLRKRDPVAARHLNECFVPSIWRFVYFRVNRDTHLTEDIVAETVLNLVSAANEQTVIESPSGWLRTVALRRIQDHYRAAARVQHLIERVGQSPSGSDQDDPAVQHDQALDRQRVRDAMGTLPEHYRLALEWKYVDLLSVALIAERLDTTEKGAEALLFRARRSLRKQLQDEPSPDSSGQRSRETTVPGTVVDGQMEPTSSPQPTQESTEEVFRDSRSHDMERTSVSVTEMFRNS